MRVITYYLRAQRGDNLRQNWPQGNSVIFATTEYFPLWNSLVLFSSRGRSFLGFLDKKGSQLTITSKFNIQLLFLMVIGSAARECMVTKNHIDIQARIEIITTSLRNEQDFPNWRVICQRLQCILQPFFYVWAWGEKLFFQSGTQRLYWKESMHQEMDKLGTKDERLSTPAQKKLGENQFGMTIA